jgi:hypothetical protein
MIWNRMRCVGIKNPSLTTAGGVDNAESTGGLVRAVLPPTIPFVPLCNYPDFRHFVCGRPCLAPYSLIENFPKFAGFLGEPDA